MRLINRAFPRDQYNGPKARVYREDEQIQAFRSAHINQAASVHSLDPVAKLLRQLFGNQAPPITRDDIKSDSAILVEGAQITEACLGEAIDFLSKAFYNYYAQYSLAEAGYDTWSKVTNYYSSFFSVHALLRLQGRCITRILGGTKYLVFTYDLLQNQYVVIPIRGKDHVAAWRLFYDLYDRYNHSMTKFELVHKRWFNDNSKPDTETEFRNELNYRPYFGFHEIWDPNLIPEFIDDYMKTSVSSTDIIETLASLATDPDYRYFARSALRLLLVYELLDSIAQANPDIQGFWTERKVALQRFASTVLSLPRQDQCIFVVRFLEIMRL